MLKNETTVTEILTQQLPDLCTRPAELLWIDGKPSGRRYENDTHTCCVVSPIMPADITESRTRQTEAVFNTMSSALDMCGMAFTDTVRTWFYLDQLLDWYDDFNAVRTAFFETYSIFDQLVPASTGIGVANPGGAAIAAGLIAVKPKKGTVTVTDVPSPLQRSAMEYRSSFSRAVEVAIDKERTLCISGTASIDADGRSTHLGDAAKQISETMNVVTAILKSRDMDWGAVTRSVLYYPDLTSHELFLKYCQSQNIPAFPHVILESDVCRRELLFEIELDARTQLGGDASGCIPAI